MHRINFYYVFSEKIGYFLNLIRVTFNQVKSYVDSGDIPVVEPMSSRPYVAAIDEHKIKK